MRIDAYYRSPVNPTNPVIVWTDGARLFFSSSAAQVTSGRALASAEVAFSPLAGYVPEEILWDRVEGLTTGGGALVVIARRPGEPDLEVAITNHLEQKSTFSALGVTSGANAQVSPEGAEFMRVNDSSVPRFEANRARAKARAGQLRAGEHGAGDVTPPAGSRSEWRSRVEGDLALAALWVELLRRYSFLPDPEGTGERRGASLADESRYSGASETTGHPADSLGEFVASFVTCATLFQTQFVADVLAAEAAGNTRGGGGGSYLRGLYRRAWNRIDVRYVPLGTNPF